MSSGSKGAEKRGRDEAAGDNHPSAPAGGDVRGLQGGNAVGKKQKISKGGGMIREEVVDEGLGNNRKRMRALLSLTELEKDQVPVCTKDSVYRRVGEYRQCFRAFAKKRWIGLTLLGVFAKEFANAGSRDYYRDAIERGLIRIIPQSVYQRRGKKKMDKREEEECEYKIDSPDTVIGNNDLILHCKHRHEPPVTSAAIEIVEETDKVLIVNKPGSIPVHPTGRYRYNSIVEILDREMGKRNLHVVHRLDRLTSGVLMFAKDSDTAREFEKLISGRCVQKEYVCRVRGSFPGGEEGKKAEEIVCDMPIKNNPQPESADVSFMCSVDEIGGKPSKTTFVKLRDVENNNGMKESLVLCRPVTGRIHQIRVHLKYLGYPISNDPIYCDEYKEELKLKAQRKEKKKAEGGEEEGIVKDTAGGENRTAELFPLCKECEKKDDDPLPEELSLYLHAKSYLGEGWGYETKMPEWAL
eukprot:Nk52_evm6s2340 gene=Nk52_evmTU6s2340